MPATDSQPLRTLKAEEVAHALNRLEEAILQKHPQPDSIILMGVANGGIPPAKRLAQRLSKHASATIRRGTVNISYHRDDIGSKPIPMVSHPTNAPFDLDDTIVILIDDVLSSGRSARAALNEVFDIGRPRVVELAVVYDCERWRLPIRANYVGHSEATPQGHKVKVVLDNDSPTHDRIDIFQT